MLVKYKFFFHRSFEQVMKAKYYEHFRLLAYAAVFSETRILSTTRLNQIKRLLDKFLDLFPLLYGVRNLTIILLQYIIILSDVLKVSNCVSIVHSLSHLYQSLINFGPVHNYSTFNFESTVGMHSLTSSIYERYLIVL